MPHVFNFCFTDDLHHLDHINDVLKIMSRCEVFCKFCRLIAKIAVDLIGQSKVNVSVSKNRLPIELWVSYLNYTSKCIQIDFNYFLITLKFVNMC